MTERKLNVKNILYNCIMYLSIIISSILICKIFDAGFFFGEEEMGISSNIKNIIYILSYCLVHYTYTHFFLLYNEYARKKYYSSFSTPPAFKENFKYIVKSQEYIIQLFFTVIFILIIPLDFASFGDDRNIPLIIFARIILFAANIIILFCAHISTLTDWKIAHKNNDNEIGKFKIKKLIKAIIMSFIIYCAFFYFLPVIWAPIYTLFNFLIKDNIVFVLFAIVLAIIIIAVCVYISAYNKRKKFIKQLTKVCDENSFILSTVNDPYISLLRDRKPYNISVTAHGKTYDCKLLCGLRKKSTMIFGMNGEGLRKHTFKIFKTEVMHTYTDFTYSFDSSNKKVVIIDPAPSDLFVGDKGKQRILDNGEILGEYSVYKAEGFINALERDVIAKN